MIDTQKAMSEAMTELKIDPSSLDANEDFEGEADNKEVEGEAVEGAVEDAEGGKQNEPSDLNGEEKNEAAPTEQAPVEEPKLTAKEFQELAAREQKIAEMEKAFTEKMALREKEFSEKFEEKVKAHDELDIFLAHLADTDSEVWDLFKGSYQNWQREFNNPAVQALREKNEALEKKLDAFMQRGTDQLTIAKLETEKNQLKSTLGKEAEAAGLKVDWDKLDETWAKYPGMPLEEAFYAKYGASLMKAKESKAKVEVAEKKVQSRPTVSTAGNIKAAAKNTQEVVPSDAFGAVHYYAKKLAGFKT